MINQIGQLSFGSDMGVHTATAVKDKDKPSFGNVLASIIGNAESTDAQFAADTQALLTGEADNLAEITINAEKAQTALSLVVTVRDKAIESYKEIMNMAL